MENNMTVKINLCLLILIIISSTLSTQQNSNIEQLYQTGLELVNEREMSAAENVFEKIISLQPNHAKSYFKLGKINLYRKKYDHAEENFKKAITINSKYAEAHNSLGTLYLQQGTIEGRIKAEHHLLTAVALDNNNAKFLTDLGILRKQQGHHYLTFNIFNEAIKNDSTYIEALLALAELHKDRWVEDKEAHDGNISFSSWAKEDLDKSFKYYQKILDINPLNKWL